MNTNSTNNQDLDNATSESEFQRKIAEMEKAGASITDRVRFATQYLESQNKKPDAASASCGSDAADEELTFDDDAVLSDSEANPPDSTATPSGSGANPSGSAAQSGSAVPPPQWPPKLPFGLGNPLWEPALDMCSYMDKRSPLDRLSPGQQNAVAQLLEDYTADMVVELLAKKAPAGLSLHVSESALNRFRKRHKKRAQLRKQLSFTLECDQLMRDSGCNDQAFLVASERLLKLRLFKASQDPDADLQTIASLTAIITKLRNQTLAEQKQNRSEQSNDSGTATAEVGPAVPSAPPNAS